VVQEKGEVSFSKTYEIPRGLLRWHSAYFAAALDPENDFQENKDGKLPLEESIAVSDAFQCWLYTGRLKDPLSDTTNATEAEVYLPTRVLCRIWAFADMRGVPGLGNAAIDMLHETQAASWSTAGRLISMVYKAASAGCGLRRYLVDLFVETKKLSGFLELAKAVKCPADFLYDAIPKLTSKGDDERVMSKQEWKEIDRCQWHDHSGPGGKLRLDSRK
jgi:hypothetical protein